MSDAILVVNAGSSSLKCRLYASPSSAADDLTLVYRTAISGIGTGSVAQLRALTAAGETLADQSLGQTDHAAAFGLLLDWFAQQADGLQLSAVGHRVVHGGGVFAKPVQISDEVLSILETFIPLAPLHQPHNLKPIQMLRNSQPQLPQVACFDTAFHHSQPAVAHSFALPRAYQAQGLRRYGFHGLSYEYIVQRLPSLAGGLPARLVVAHLGNGASMTAIRDGQSLATTMSFTALDGLMMGTRCGSIDPGVLLHLLAQGMTPAALSHLLYEESGLLGVSGLSNDMATLLASPEPAAAEAVALFVYRISRELGSLAAALGGLDALVFTAGIGEQAAAIRAAVCSQAAWLGVKLDAQANATQQPCISLPDSPVSVWVVPTDEEKMIARHTWRVLHGQ